MVFLASRKAPQRAVMHAKPIISQTAANRLTMHPEDLTIVAQSGDSFLLARRADLDAGRKNGDAWVFEARTQTASQPKPLQVWFKWGLWPDPRLAEDAAAEIRRQAAGAITEAANPR